MKPCRKQCEHLHDEIDIVSITPAQPGWSYAVAFEIDRDDPEFIVHPIAAWAVVRSVCDACERERSLVLPMLPRNGELCVETPVALMDDCLAAVIVEPGMRPVLDVRNGRGKYARLRTIPGDVTLGEQVLELLPSDESGQALTERAS